MIGYLAYATQAGPASGCWSCTTDRAGTSPEEGSGVGNWATWPWRSTCRAGAVARTRRRRPGWREPSRGTGPRCGAGPRRLEAWQRSPRSPGKLAAIGFCFGGTTVLELAASGAPGPGVVSFHGACHAGPADATNIRARCWSCTARTTRSCRRRGLRLRGGDATREGRLAAGSRTRARSTRSPSGRPRES